MTKNKRTPPFVFVDTYDPFAEQQAIPDDNVRPIAPVTTPNGLTRTDARTLASAIPQQCSALDRAVYAQKFISNPQRLQEAQEAADAAEQHAQRLTRRAAIRDFTERNY